MADSGFQRGIRPLYRLSSITLNTKGYNDRWNSQRATLAPGKKTPNEVIIEAYIKVMALMLFVQNAQNTALYKLDQDGNAFLPIPKLEKIIKKKKITRSQKLIEQYLNYLEWAERNKYKCILFGNPTMSQTSSIYEKKRKVQFQ